MALPQDIEKAKKTPTAFVIFGATGDLSRKKIFPSFFELYKSNLLPQDFKIIASARSKISQQDFAISLKEHIQVKDYIAWDKFAKVIEYVASDVAQDLDLEKISKSLDKFEEQIAKCTQRVFYMAISPFIYEKAFETLGARGMHKGCHTH